MNRRQVLAGALVAAASQSIARVTDADFSVGNSALHEDPVVIEGLFAGRLRLSHIQGMRKGGVHCGVAAGPNDMSSYAELLEFLDQHRQEVVIARSVADIRQARADGKISHVFCWQGAGALGSAFNSPMGNSHTALRAFQEIGLRIVGPCYNVVNEFGGGCLEPNVGLTRAGRRLVEQIHSLNIVLDVGGHTGEQTTLDAIAMSAGVPVVCTHTNVAALADNSRAVSDRVIDAIAGTGGVIGLSAVSDFHVRGKDNIGRVPQVGLDAHVDQYEYIRNRVGIDHVGMGTDFVDGMPIPYGGGVNRDIIPPDMIDEPWRYVKGFEKIEELPNLISAFRRRGWSQPDIDKAMGLNWLRVYERVWRQ